MAVALVNRNMDIVAGPQRAKEGERGKWEGVLEMGQQGIVPKDTEFGIYFQ